MPDSVFEKSHAAFMNYDFPFASLKDGQIRAELLSLAGNDLGDRTRSAVIKSFHRSMAGCKRAGLDSPMRYWNGLKDDYLKIKDVWRDVFVNRYVYGNSSDADRLRSDGAMSPNLVLEAVTVSKKAAFVSYLKPALAKRLAKTYLRAYDRVFCPFNGFSGIMLGCTVGCGKKFIGRDINATEIEESRKIVEKARGLGFDVDADLGVADVFESSGTYDCMLCCPPYQDIEQWNFDADGRNSDRNLPCEKWIDECLARFDCGRYVFVVDEKTVGKYASNVVERLENRSHFGVNYECVVVIDRRGK